MSKNKKLLDFYGKLDKTSNNRSLRTPKEK